MKTQLRCWEFFDCSEEDCPAHKLGETRCWLVADTLCRGEIQGKFLEKIELCLTCEAFKANMDVDSIEETLKLCDAQFREFRRIVEKRDRELEGISMELALGLSEVFEALKQIASGNPDVKISEDARIELLAKLNCMVNQTAESLGEIVNLAHEFAIGLAEHFDALHRVSAGDLSARIIGTSPVELLERLKQVTNAMIESVSREITERKEAEDALRESESMYSNLVHESPDAIVSLDMNGAFLSFNKAAERMSGFSAEEMIGKAFHKVDILAKKSIPKALEGFSIVIKGEESQPFDLTIVRKDKSCLIMEANPRLVRQKGGEPWVEVVLRDITERFKVQQLLKESEERYRTLFEGAVEGILVADIQTKQFKRGNPAICRMLGYSHEELTQLNVFDIHPKEALDHVVSKFEAQARGEIKLAPDLPCLRKDGTTIYADINTALVQMDGTACNVGFFTDITERKLAEGEKVRLEARLRHVQKMEAVGTLVGGLAHDFNNLFSMILGNISMAKEDVKPEHGISGFLNEAEKACSRARDLTHQLVTFAHRGAPVRKKTVIGETLRSSVQLALSGSNVNCEFIMPDDLWPVECDKGQIGSVIKNLITNGLEAMPQGGTIKVRTRNLKVNREKKSLDGQLKMGDYVQISIQDEGVGIPEKDIPKIFDPYFSTKQMGTQKGMGLGLSTAYSIINRHHGHIAVESKVGSGTTLHIYLPASEKAAEEAVSHRCDKDNQAPGTKKVLVMDDEEMIRNLTKNMLDRLGYEAEVAKDGSEAVELYRRAKDEGKLFDAVILDMTVRGGMGGKETVRSLFHVDPQVKAIACTGYTDDPVMTNWREYGFSGVIAKPFVKKDLGDALRQVMLKVSDLHF